MPTLISVITADGRCLGRCDARCYDATPGACHCICGGRNHAVGLRAAAANSRTLAYPDPAGFTQPAPPQEIVFKKHPNLSKLSHPTLF